MVNVRTITLTVCLTLLAGCTSTEPVFLTTGQHAARIRCGNALDGMAACFKAAGDVCGPQGFTIYDWNGKAWPRPYPDPYVAENRHPEIANTGLLVACGA
jgi:hypothetical protein